MKTPSRPGNTVFEQIKEIDEKGNEFWGARRLSKILEYSEFRHFLPVVDRAKDACLKSGHQIADHFEDYLEEIVHGKGAKQEYNSIKLSRYACYLIVQNADPSKEVVALGQTYFAVQTRLQEIRQMEDYTRLTTEDEKRFLNKKAPETLDFFNLHEVFKKRGVIFFLQYFIAYGEFRVAD